MGVDIKSKSVKICAPARLHFGFLDPSGASGRKYASIGLVIEGFDAILEIEKNEKFVVNGSICNKEIINFIHKTINLLNNHFNFDSNFGIKIQNLPPRHSGFGSGTQLALAISKAYSNLNSLGCSVRELSNIIKRGKRSGIGIAGFESGGFLVDGGKSQNTDLPPPLINRVNFPDEWRIILVLQRNKKGLHGKLENQVIESLPFVSKSDSSFLCHETFLKILPAIIERNFPLFAEGLTEIQDFMGKLFYVSHGNSFFSSKEVGKLLMWFNKNFETSIGQSSWGPTGFAFFESNEIANKALNLAKSERIVSNELEVVIVKSKNSGFKIL